MSDNFIDEHTAETWMEKTTKIYKTYEEWLCVIQEKMYKLGRIAGQLGIKIPVVGVTIKDPSLETGTKTLRMSFVALPYDRDNTEVIQYIMSNPDQLRSIQDLIEQEAQKLKLHIIEAIKQHEANEELLCTDLFEEKLKNK